MKIVCVSKKIIVTIIIFILLLGIYFWNCNYKTIQVMAKQQNNYKILVDVEESKMYVFENNICIKQYSCAGGKYSTPSPIGTWKIISKGKWGEGFGRKLVRI